MFLAKALRDLEAAKKSTAEVQIRLRKEFAAKVDKAIDKIAGEVEGDPSVDKREALRRIREDVYGIFQS